MPKLNQLVELRTASHEMKMKRLCLSSKRLLYLVLSYLSSDSRSPLVEWKSVFKSLTSKSSCPWFNSFGIASTTETRHWHSVKKLELKVLGFVQLIQNINHMTMTVWSSLRVTVNWSIQLLSYECVLYIFDHFRAEVALWPLDSRNSIVDLSVSCLVCWLDCHFEPDWITSSNYNYWNWHKLLCIKCHWFLVPRLMSFLSPSVFSANC